MKKVIVVNKEPIPQRDSDQPVIFTMTLYLPPKRGFGEYGITKKDFHSILDKASQPIKREAQSDSEKSET